MAERLLRKSAAPVQRPIDEATAAAMLEAQRGRAPIRNFPTAGRHAAAVLRPIFAQEALGIGALRRRWSEIVGESLGRACTPEKLAAGVLTVRAASAIAPFVQHQAPLIMERCRLAGAQLKGVRIEQGAPLATRRTPNIKPLCALSPTEEKAIAAPLQRIEDEGLKAALARLGRAIAQRG